MTNHWADIDNSSLIFVMGANPAENHPACMGHVNAARFDTLGRGRKARLVVIDPRKTRTALQADLFVRIRPGTDIAFLNGMLNYIFQGVDGGTLDSTFTTNLKAWHNGLDADHVSVARTFVDDAGVTRTLTSAELQGAQYGGVATSAFTTVAGGAAGWPKYCDSRMQVNSSGAFVDYQRDVLTTKSYNPAVSTTAWKFTNMPVLLPTVDTAGSVWNRLKAHVANYTAAEVADICGCNESDIAACADELIANSRMMSSDFALGTSNPASSTYKAGSIFYAMGQTQHTYGSQNIRDLAVVQTLLGNMGRPGGGINALRGIHNVQGSTDFANLYDGIPGYSGNPGTSYDAYTDGLFGNRTLSTAPGFGDRYEPRKLGLQQRGFYNMTTQWFGQTGTLTATTAAYTLETAKTFTLANTSINMGTVVVRSAAAGGGTLFADGVDYTMNYATGVITRVAYKAIPDTSTVYVSYTYGAVPVTVTDEAAVFPSAAATIAAVGGTTALKDVWLKPGTVTLTGSGSVSLVEGVDFSVDSQTGVITRLGGAITPSMTFIATYDKWAKRTDAEFEALYALWPKGNGLDHISAFRAMGSTYARTDAIKALVCWGQNPAVTEPNQSFIRDGLENLDLLVVTDIFATETAECKRKASGVTYLLPSCSHVEEAGSVTNSGRWLQWRDRARAPHGNSKADLELLLRFSKALASAGAFSRITTKWSTAVTSITGDVWDVLYGKYCTGWDGVTAGGFEALTFSDTDRIGSQYSTVYGSEAVAESVFKEICRPLDDASVGAGGGGVMWIYSGMGSASGYNALKTNVSPTIANYTALGGTNANANWSTVNRAKSRDSSFAGEALTYSRYGWSWLLNRRVFYNNSEVQNDVADVFVAPGVIARLMTFDYKNTNTKANWSLLYRAYNTVKDTPSKTGAGTPHAAGLPGNFPAFTEPIETPRRDLASKYGRNLMYAHTAGDTVPTIKSDSKAALWSSTDPVYPTDASYGSWLAPVGSLNFDAADYPLVLTTIRCVEHFQGGPITRNNTWNVEAEPVPWIEINTDDARKYGIADGDWVNIETPRSNSTTDQMNRTNNTPANWARGFKARVGVGLQSNQRVGAGVVAIPWHWGDKGLSTGSRANDLCIDAFDSNTQIPEYKACLCKISKL